ncbi:histidine kinase [Pseudoxanthomonas winnipegensis]|uniref:sensor histidine kinase n=1 Tax=Pseudoxanthomonas winnipegensis TaxID=2480810 RepID=UPI002574CE5F|nr:histidine kinase [Pseudoxanthomonas winnipegensis]WJI15775.1 histidine kinase [Pseudoxanthomonas winnipegensis]
MAVGHQCDLPEVTTCRRPIAHRTRTSEHRPMRPTLREFFEPLNIAGLITIAAVTLSFGFEADGGVLRWWLLGGFAGLFIAYDWIKGHAFLRDAALCVQAALALWLVYLEPRAGTAPVLLVMLVAHAAMCWRPAVVLAFGVAINVGLYLTLDAVGVRRQWLMVVIYASFQAFSALVAYYARNAERTRDALALVNADLLATRALLADSARDAERLRVARELHDVAGHKLTAMKLNLRALAGDPALAERSEVRIAQQLSSELLDDIRSVVQALRDTRGLDLHTALRALAAPLPRPALALDIAADATVTDPALAETLLRVVQEALTNTARHTDADTLHVRLAREGEALLLRIEDNGQRATRLREGNGLSGMRERIAAARGRLDIDLTPHGALRLTARIPA